MLWFPILFYVVNLICFLFFFSIWTKFKTNIWECRWTLGGQFASRPISTRKCRIQLFEIFCANLVTYEQANVISQPKEPLGHSIQITLWTVRYSSRLGFSWNTFSWVYLECHGFLDASHYYEEIWQKNKWSLFLNKKQIDYGIVFPFPGYIWVEVPVVRGILWS